MRHLAWPTARIRFDLSDRVVAIFGITAVTVSATLAAVAYLLIYRFVHQVDMPRGTGWRNSFGIGSIATLFLLYMLGTALFLAIKPSMEKSVLWVVVSLAATWLLLNIALANFPFNGWGSHLAVGY
ncbi:MAG: hypothetical protein AAGI68_11130 [Planctomycetota bacterium]